METNNYLYDLARLMFEAHKGEERPKCFYCEKEFSSDMDGFSNIAIDHLQSRYDGGKDAIENYVISCKVCNSAKGNKSFEKGSKELEDFKKVQKRVSKLNNEWVKKLFSYMQLQEYPERRFFEEFLSALERDNRFKNAREYKKKDGYWIEWYTNESDCWYFNLIGFELQPHFLFKKINWSNEKINAEIIDELYENGYYYDHLMTNNVR